VCLHDAERILSAIVKFLVHLLGEGEKRGKIRKGKKVGREGEDMEGWELGMHENNSPKRNTFGIWGRPLGSILLRVIDFRNIFTRATFASFASILQLLEVIKRQRMSQQQCSI